MTAQELIQKLMEYPPWYDVYLGDDVLTKEDIKRAEITVGHGIRLASPDFVEMMKEVNERGVKGIPRDAPCSERHHCPFHDPE